MSKKAIKMPDSDTSARHGREDQAGEMNEAPPESLADRQTSNKAGSHSTVEKLAASRSEFAPRASAGQVSGAFGDVSPEPAGTGQFRCSACGRYFDVERDLRVHETECRAAKQATAAGQHQLAAEDSAPHAPNDEDK
jgi:hypothetical protein